MQTATILLILANTFSAIILIALLAINHRLARMVNLLDEANTLTIKSGPRGANKSDKETNQGQELN